MKENAGYLRALEMIRGEFEERTWAAFWRTTVEGQAPKDVGLSLSMSPGAVRVAKSRVLHRLREELGDLMEQFKCRPVAPRPEAYRLPSNRPTWNRSSVDRSLRDRKLTVCAYLFSQRPASRRKLDVYSHHTAVGLPAKTVRTSGGSPRSLRLDARLWLN